MFDFDKLTNRRGTSSLKWDVEARELPMWVADMDFETAPCVKAALKKRVEEGIFGYQIVPDEWYEAILSWWERRHGLRLQRDWLQFTTGVVPAISSAVKRLTNVGDSVALLTPVYDIFYHSVENAGRHVLECPLDYSDGAYSIPFARLEEALSRPLTTLLILCNPHNPTGNVWTREELARIGALCEKHGVTVLSDEIHCDITAPGTRYTPFASASEVCLKNSVVCIAASKAFNLAGLQSAAVYSANKRLRDAVFRGLNSDEVAEPNCFAVMGTVAAFNEGETWLDELVSYLFENRKFAEEFLLESAPAVRVVPAKATYLLWVDCGKLTQNSDELCAALREETGLVLSSGEQYRGNGATFVRLNLACPRARLSDGLSRFANWLNKNSPAD